MNEAVSQGTGQALAPVIEVTTGTEDDEPLRRMRDIITDAGYKHEEVSDEDVRLLAYHWQPRVQLDTARCEAFDELIAVFDRLPNAPPFRALTERLYRELLPKRGLRRVTMPLAVTLWVQGRWVAGGNGMYALGREFDYYDAQDTVRVEVLSRLYTKYTTCTSPTVGD